jgi:hypothetical protein
MSVARRYVNAELALTVKQSEVIMGSLNLVAALGGTGALVTCCVIVGPSDVHDPSPSGRTLLPPRPSAAPHAQLHTSSTTFKCTTMYPQG